MDKRGRIALALRHQQDAHPGRAARAKGGALGRGDMRRRRGGAPTEPLVVNCLPTAPSSSNTLPTFSMASPAGSSKGGIRCTAFA